MSIATHDGMVAGGKHTRIWFACGCGRVEGSRGSVSSPHTNPSNVPGRNDQQRVSQNSDRAGEVKKSREVGVRFFFLPVCLPACLP